MLDGWGSGENIDIYTDRWLASGELISLNANPNLSKVKDIIDPINKCWNIRLIRENFQPAQAIQILQTPIAWNCGQDSIWWPKSKSRDFTVKSGYYQMKKQVRATTQHPLHPRLLQSQFGKKFGDCVFLKRLNSSYGNVVIMSSLLRKI